MALTLNQISLINEAREAPSAVARDRSSSTRTTAGLTGRLTINRAGATHGCEVPLAVTLRELTRPPDDDRGCLTLLSDRAAGIARKDGPSGSTGEWCSTTSNTRRKAMDLGAFSVSLAVKDLQASRQFYEKFGFEVVAGDPSQNWLILKNGDHVIGLFQGMFDKNILTFNPGWDSSARELATFTDVRELQRQLKAQSVQLVNGADESTTGPGSFMAIDPDGNPILVDQHV
jgi:lactoylglutathione lyase